MSRIDRGGLPAGLARELIRRCGWKHRNLLNFGFDFSLGITLSPCRTYEALSLSVLRLICHTLHPGFKLLILSRV